MIPKREKKKYTGAPRQAAMWVRVRDIAKDYSELDRMKNCVSDSDFRSFARSRRLSYDDALAEYQREKGKDPDYLYHRQIAPDTKAFIDNFPVNHFVKLLAEDLTGTERQSLQLFCSDFIQDEDGEPSVSIFNLPAGTDMYKQQKTFAPEDTIVITKDPELYRDRAENGGLGFNFATEYIGGFTVLISDDPNVHPIGQTGRVFRPSEDPAKQADAIARAWNFYAKAVKERKTKEKKELA